MSATLPSIERLRAVVRKALGQAGFSSRHHPEYDDLEQEAVLAAWYELAEGDWNRNYHWSTIAGRRGIDAARHWLGSRRSGRMANISAERPGYCARFRGGRMTEGERAARLTPVPLSSVDLRDKEQPVWDGGFLAAEARLQLWCWPARLTERQRLVLDLYYRKQLSMPEIARALGVSYGAVNDSREAALNKYRRFLEAG